MISGCIGRQCKLTQSCCSATAVLQSSESNFIRCSQSGNPSIFRSFGATTPRFRMRSLKGASNMVPMWSTPRRMTNGNPVSWLNSTLHFNGTATIQITVDDDSSPVFVGHVRQIGVPETLPSLPQQIQRNVLELFDVEPSSVCRWSHRDCRQSTGMVVQAHRLVCKIDFSS